MNKILILIVLSFTLISCATIKDKLPERKACDGSNETLSDVFCKKS